MYHNKKGLKIALIIICIGFMHQAGAQSVGQKLENVATIYDYVFKQNKKADSAAFTLTISKAKFAEATSILNDVAKNGTVQEQAVGRWLASLMKYEVAFALYNAGEYDKAYALCKEARGEMNNVAASSTVLEYVAGSTRHSFPVSEITKVCTESKDILAGIASRLGKYDEAISLSLEVLADPNLSAYQRYQNAARIWYAKKKKAQFDSVYVQYNLSALREWSRIDTADKRMLRENNYYRGSSFSSELSYLLTINIPGVNKATTARTAAFYLDSVHEVDDAKAFYEEALSYAPENKSVLWQTLDFAEREHFPELAAKANAGIEKAYIGETDETVRSLGHIIPKIVASANDPARHLKDLEGNTFRCKYFHDKVRRSTIELSNVLSTCIWEFYKNDQANYYEWMAFVSEEKFADQQGPLRAKYDAICAEVRNIYPDIPVVFDYNDNRYFTMDISPAVQLKVHIYGNAGGKDFVSLTITSKMPKNVP